MLPRHLPVGLPVGPRGCAFGLRQPVPLWLGSVPAALSRSLVVGVGWSLDKRGFFLSWGSVSASRPFRRWFLGVPSVAGVGFSVQPFGLVAVGCEPIGYCGFLFRRPRSCLGENVIFVLPMIVREKIANIPVLFSVACRINLHVDRSN